MTRRTAQKFTFKDQSNKEGFTLIELLVVIAIIAIIAAVVAILINPVELTKRGRDSNRLTDLANLQQAINVAGEENAAATNLYCGNTPTKSPQVAIADCGGSQAGGAGGAGTNPGQGVGTSNGGTRALDGSGWVKVDLSGSPNNVLQTPTLPVDPQNTALLHYTYCGTNHASPGITGYQMSAVLESAQQSPKMTNDGGTDNGLYDAGSNLTLIKIAAGALCTW